MKAQHPEVEVPWKNAKVVCHEKGAKTTIFQGMPYPHMSDYVEVDKKKYKDPENPGTVLIGPPNMKTMPMKKGTVPNKA